MLGIASASPSLHVNLELPTSTSRNSRQVKSSDAKMTEQALVSNLSHLDLMSVEYQKWL